MKTKMNPRSLDAYDALQKLGQLPTCEMQVYLAVALHGPMTREQIAERIGAKEGAVCGRVNALIHKRRRLVETGEVFNVKTEKYNGVVDLPLDHRAMFPRQQ